MAQWVKNSPATARGLGSIPGSGKSPGGGNGYALQYACLENPMDRRTWGATGHRDAKRCTGQSIRKGHGACMSSPGGPFSQHLHVFTNPEAP